MRSGGIERIDQRLCGEWRCLFLLRYTSLRRFEETRSHGLSGGTERESSIGPKRRGEGMLGSGAHMCPRLQGQEAEGAMPGVGAILVTPLNGSDTEIVPLRREGE